MSVTLSSLTSEKQLGFLNRQAVAVSLSVVMVQQFWSIVIVVGMMVSVLARARAGLGGCFCADFRSKPLGSGLGAHCFILMLWQCGLALFHAASFAC
jgi:hypothetical protein